MMSGTGLRSSLSADDVGSPSNRKPGKLSAEFMAKFESDSAIGGSTGAIPQRLSHASSSGMGSSSASHEHLEPIKPHVKIQEPEATGDEDGKNEKKRKSIWKWSPLKKMRKFFNRRKSNRRTKSFEDLRTESYKPKSESDESLGRRGAKFSPVVRTSTMPANTKVPVVRELKERQSSSNDDVKTTDSFGSKASSLPVLATPEPTSGRQYKNIEEDGVSFESNPNSSSLEGLQAAHDKIKSAPKGRRPPSKKRRSGSATSNLSVDTPVRGGQKTPHRRSKTDPKDLSRDRLDDSGSLSDILNNTIFEEEDSSKLRSSVKEKSKVLDQKNAFDEITTRANEALSRASGSTKRVEQKPKNIVEVEKVEVKKKEVEKPEVRKPEVTNLQPKKPEDTKPEVKSKPLKKEEATKTKESKSEVDSSSKTADVKRGSKRYSLDESTRKSFTDSVLSSKSDSDILKVEFTSLLQSDPSESFWKEPESQNSPAQKEETAKATSREETSKPATKEESAKPAMKEESAKPVPRRKTSQDKSTQITTTPFKRGKSWSSNNIAKIADTPVKQDIYKDQKETSMDNSTDQDKEDDSSYSDKKDFRFSRTKSWSYGMKTVDLTKATGNLTSSPKKPQSGSSEKVDNEPTWIAKANRVSKRMSQMMQEDENSENQTPTLHRSNDEPTKPETSSKALASTPPKPKSTISKDTKPAEISPKPVKPTVTKDTRTAEIPPKPAVLKPAVETPAKPTVTKDTRPSEISPKPAFSKPIVEKDTKSSEIAPKPAFLKSAVEASAKPKQTVTKDIKPSEISPKPLFPKPVVDTPSKPKSTIGKDTKTTENSPKPALSKPVETASKPKSTISKDVEQTESSPKPSPAQKPSSFVRSTASLPRIVGSTSSNSDTKATPTRTSKSLNKPGEAKPSAQQTARASFNNVKIEKCIVCGTTVYQMEKCKFDDSVLHRNCIKCTVCKRHLTVGNFVMTESKIYCKPHSQAVVSVST